MIMPYVLFFFDRGKSKDQDDLWSGDDFTGRDTVVSSLDPGQQEIRGFLFLHSEDAKLLGACHLYINSISRMTLTLSK
jgi:hypothetical protein